MDLLIGLGLIAIMLGMFVHSLVTKGVKEVASAFIVVFVFPILIFAFIAFFSGGWMWVVGWIIDFFNAIFG